MNAETLQKLAGLPWGLQIVLGCGYVAYLLAYVGIRHHHKPVDAVFLTIAFGLPALLALSFTQKNSVAVQIVSAMIAAAMPAIIWRALGRHVLRWIFRKLRYSYADDTLSAWDHLNEDNRHFPTQLTVETADGFQHHCTNASLCRDLPFGPFVLGTNGDVLMYVDQSEGPTASERDVKQGVIDNVHGHYITYFPASQIRRIGIRYAPATSLVAEAARWVVKVVRMALSMLRRL